MPSAAVCLLSLTPTLPFSLHRSFAVPLTDYSVCANGLPASFYLLDFLPPIRFGKALHLPEDERNGHSRVLALL